jgi:myo-inositol catabolism protein IolC
MTMPKKIMNCGFRDWTPDKLPDLQGKTYLICRPFEKPQSKPLHYSPPVGNGTKGRVIPVSARPKMKELVQARMRLGRIDG